MENEENQPGSKNQAEPLKFQAPCLNLRSKEMYYGGSGADEDEYSSDAYWCGKTSDSLGPDGGLVGKRECCVGRSCYVG